MIINANIKNTNGIVFLFILFLLPPYSVTALRMALFTLRICSVDISKLF